MGFTDTKVNRRLLAAYGGDVEAVITLLLNSGGDPNLLEVTKLMVGCRVRIDGVQSRYSAR